MHHTAMDHAISTLTDRIVQLKVSLVTFDIRLHNSIRPLT